MFSISLLPPPPWPAHHDTLSLVAFHWSLEVLVDLPAKKKDTNVPHSLVDLRQCPAVERVTRLQRARAHRRRIVSHHREAPQHLRC